jgi:hypothetical protein
LSSLVFVSLFFDLFVLSGAHCHSGRAEPNFTKVLLAVALLANLSGGYGVGELDTVFEGTG